MSQEVLYEDILKNYEVPFKAAGPSDVTITIRGTKLPAHRELLADHSQYFRDLLHNKDRTSNDENEIELDTSLTSFYYYLEFTYTKELNSMDTIEDLVDLLDLAMQYSNDHLKDLIENKFVSMLNTEDTNWDLFNTLYGIAITFDIIGMKLKYISIIEMAIEGYNDNVKLTLEILMDVMQLRRRLVSEVKLLEELFKHSLTAEQVEIVGKNMRIATMNSSELESIMPLFFNASDIFHEICHYYCRNDRVPTVEMGFLHKTRKLFTRPAWKSEFHEWVSIDLKEKFKFNHIRFVLETPVSFLVEVHRTKTSGGTEIVVVAAFSSVCRREQNIHFPEMIGQKVRIMRTSKDDNCEFQVKQLEVLYDLNPPKSCRGCVVADSNVVTNSTAVCYAGPPLALNLLESQFVNYESRQISTNDVFVVQLDQPAILSSCQLKMHGWKNSFLRMPSPAFTISIECPEVTRKQVIYSTEGGPDEFPVVEFEPQVVSRFYIEAKNCVTNFSRVHLKACADSPIRWLYRTVHRFRQFVTVYAGIFFSSESQWQEIR